MWKTGGPDASEMATPKRVRTYIQKIAIQFAFSQMEDKYGKKNLKKVILKIHIIYYRNCVDICFNLIKKGVKIGLEVRLQISF